MQTEAVVNNAREKTRAKVEILSDTEIQITRVFDAPRDLVWEVITQKDHVEQWYGCAAMKMTICEIDLKVGGKWRYALGMPDGSQHAFSGVFREITKPTRLVRTENYEPIGPGHEMLATVTLEDKGGKTTFKNVLKYPSKADRDGHLASGMENGLHESLDRLEARARSLANK